MVQRCSGRFDETAAWRSAYFIKERRRVGYGQDNDVGVISRRIPECESGRLRGAPGRGWVLGSTLAEAVSPPFRADSLVAMRKNYTRLLEFHLFSPILPRGAC